MARSVTGERALAAVLTPILAIAAWLLAVHAIAAATHSFAGGLIAGTFGAGLTGYGAALMIRRRRVLGLSGNGISPLLIITVLASTAFIAPTSLGWLYHDEVGVSGHLAIPSQILNNIYPPRYMTFPEIPYRYHYGFDLLTASLATLFRLPVDRAIDVATISLWVLTWALLYELGARLLGKRNAWLTPLCVMFGGGAPIFCGGTDPSWIPNMLSRCTVANVRTTVPVASYFFQHPWSLGLPLAIAAILIAFDERPRSARASFCVLVLLLAMLSFGEIALYVTVAPSIVAARLWSDGRFQGRRIAPTLLAVCVSLVGAVAMGGFFTRHPGLPHLTLHLSAGYLPKVRDSVSWTLKSFGLLLPLGLVGGLLLGESGILYGLLAVGSLLVVHGVAYEASFDIVKFATVAAIALGVLTSATIARILPPCPSAAHRSFPRRVVAVSLLLLALLSGISWPLVFLLRLPGIPQNGMQADALSRDDEAAVAWLRTQIRPGEIVFRRKPICWAYAQSGGLPGAFTDLALVAYGFGARVKEREAFLLSLPPEADLYAHEHFRWFVLDAADAKLSGIADTWIHGGVAREAKRIGALRIIELFPPG